MKLRLLASLTLALSGCGGADPASSHPPPNIVYILADDLGYGELGAYGQTKIETPHIDRLAERGMRFTEHYAGSPVCAPSRCVLLTGQHSGRCAIRGNDEMRERGEVWDFAKATENPNLEGQRPLPADTVTVGHILQKAGYRTAVVGKWGLGYPGSEGIPNRQGFDFFFGYNCQRQAHTYYPVHLWRNEEKVRLGNRLVTPGSKLREGADPADPASYDDFNLEQYAPELLLREALGFIESNRDRPFFLYFASPIPHAPLQAPQSWVERYRERLGPEQPYLGERGYFPHPAPRAAYAAMVGYLDSQVGSIVEKLKELGLYENTLILFSSDNGPTYNGGSDSAFFESAGPFRSDRGWGKGSVHEGGLRVPLIASWPGRIREGSTSGHVSAFYDVLPTLAEAAGAAVPPHADGLSFLPELLGREQDPHAFLYWEFPSYGGQQAVRMGDWKAIRRNIFEGNLTIELYNLADDPQESRDLAARHPDIVERIEEIMSGEHTTSPVERFRFPQLGD